MDPNVQPFDLHRMFVGDLPPAIYLEIGVRTVVMYAYTLLVVRFLGKRAQAELTPFEYVILIALGSAVGDPLFYPQVPLLHCMFVVTVIVLLQRCLVGTVDRLPRLESFVESDPRCLVQDGVVNRRALRRERLSLSELLSELRQAGIRHLGQVRWAYLEPSGRISAIRTEDEIRPGLTTLPGAREVLVSSGSRGEPGPWACVACGGTVVLERQGSLPPCPRCQAAEWTAAVS